MFCITLEPSHLNFIKSLNYVPVGLGEKKFSSDFMNDRNGDNISKKNKNYGEYTFHYWLWKNHLQNIDKDWIGFCQYRKFWSLTFTPNNELNINNLQSKVLKEIPEILECHYTTGDWSVLAKLICKDNEDLMKILTKKIQSIKGVSRTETYISLEQQINRQISL